MADYRYVYNGKCTRIVKEAIQWWEHLTAFLLQIHTQVYNLVSPSDDVCVSEHSQQTQYNTVIISQF
mgnify:CR=1 FL=1